MGLVSTAAANQGTTSYDAYGGVLATTGTQGIVGYQGDITDAATKQVDMGTRWYAPGQGRFTSRDVLFGELSSPMTLNQFAYAGGNPITMWDPNGMRPTCRPECDSDTEKDITNDYSDTANEGGDGYTCNCYDPSPPPPDPAPAITYVREGGDYVDAASTDSFLQRIFDSSLLGEDGSGSFSGEVCERFSFDVESCAEGDPPNAGDLVVTSLLSLMGAVATWRTIRAEDRAERVAWAGISAASAFSLTCYQNRRFHTGSTIESIFGRDSTIFDSIDGCRYEQESEQGEDE